MTHTYYDEANELPECLWDAAKKLVSDLPSCMICIGSPSNPVSTFDTKENAAPISLTSFDTLDFVNGDDD